MHLFQYKKPVFHCSMQGNLLQLLSCGTSGNTHLLSMVEHVTRTRHWWALTCTCWAKVECMCAGMH